MKNMHIDKAQQLYKSNGWELDSGYLAFDCSP
jgi:hypothetical protein